MIRSSNHVEHQSFVSSSTDKGSPSLWAPSQAPLVAARRKLTERRECTMVVCGSITSYGRQVPSLPRKLWVSPYISSWQGRRRNDGQADWGVRMCGSTWMDGSTRCSICLIRAWDLIKSCVRSISGHVLDSLRCCAGWRNVCTWHRRRWEHGLAITPTRW